MARRKGSGNLRYGVMAVVISLVLWGIAHGERRAERNVDIPVVFNGLPDNLVITHDAGDLVAPSLPLAGQATANPAAPTPVQAAQPAPALPTFTVNQ